MWETNGSTSMSPASQRSTSAGTWSRPFTPPNDEPPFTPLRRFFHVTLPVLRPGMLVGALFAFLSSFNEAVVALFIAGRGAATLPKKMYESIRLESDPVIAVVSTLLVSVVVLGVLVSVFMRGRTAHAS